jgi:hypothetical protein
MPANILNVEREKILQENRRHNSNTRANTQTPPEKEAAQTRRVLSGHEAKLQALAEAERQRRMAAGEPPSTAKPGTGKPAKSAMAAKPATTAKPTRPAARPGFQPPVSPLLKEDRPVAAPEPEPAQADEKACSIVRVHPDGTFDLKLSSGEVVEQVDRAWLQKLQRLPESPAPRPPSASGSRPGTGLVRPGSAQPKAEGAERSGSGAPAVIDLSDAPAATLNLDNTLSDIARRGGRGTIGARRAALSEISGALAWQ